MITKTETNCLNMIDCELTYSLASLYISGVQRLWSEIDRFQPKHILFLTRSAVIVQWILEGLVEQLDRDEHNHQNLLKKVQPISISKKVGTTTQAVASACKHYHIGRNDPVLVVDEFTEALPGRRDVDYAANAIQQAGPTKIRPFVLLDGTRYRFALQISGLGETRSPILGYCDSITSSAIPQVCHTPRELQPFRSQLINSYRSLGQRVAETIKR